MRRDLSGLVLVGTDAVRADAASESYSASMRSSVASISMGRSPDDDLAH